MSQAPHPRMHGLTHVAGGSDPIPQLGSGIGGDWTGRVLSLSGLVGYWRLGDGASPYADSSGLSPAADMAATAAGPNPFSPDVTGLLPEGQDDGAVAFNHPAGDGVHADFLSTGAAPRFNFLETHPYSAVALIKPGAAGGGPGGIVGNMDNVGGSPNWLGGWELRLNWPTMAVGFARGTSSTTFNEAVSSAVSAATTYMVAGTYDGTTIRVYVNATLADSQPDTNNLPGTSSLRIGGYPKTASTWSPFYGVIDEVAVFDRALTAAELANLYDAATTPDTAAAGWVQTADGNGGVTWQPPGIEVSHGDGTPDPEPVSNAWTPSGSTSVSGWRLDAHHETAVLYDSSPGRFDMPSMKWVRVPFNTVRIWRTWEPTVGVASLKTEWLPDDRGLTTQARDGLLHIAAGMEGTPDADGHHQTVASWAFSPEWPFLDWRKLPNGGDPLAIDNYVRAARVVDLSHGFVLRDYAVGPTFREFFEWSMFDPADGTPEWVSYAGDNPYPVYPVWPERPLVLPPPYPKMSDTESGVYYAPFKEFRMKATLAAGSNLCVQAWQDAPWLLRFSTDTYRIPYPGLSPKWGLRPYLTISYSYDPETIDHTTGTIVG